MVATSDFIPFASGGSANVVSQATYAADIDQTSGQPSGATRTLTSAMSNKIWRQAAWGTAALAQLIVNAANQNAQDNGSLTQFQNSLQTAIQNVGTANALLKPQGRLTLSTGIPVPNTDVSGSTQVFYTGFIGDLIPIWNGTAWQNFVLTSDLALTLNSSIAVASGIYDVFAFNNSGTATLGIGPQWTSTSGRGTGAGTTQISRINNAFFTNTNSITLNNGASQFAGLAANTCIYLGSIAVDTTAGQVSCFVSAGQNRKWGVWNAFNRQKIILQTRDPTASWTIGNTTRVINNNSANNALIFMGLAEEYVKAAIVYGITNGSTNLGTNAFTTGIGWGSQTAFTDNTGFVNGNSLNSNVWFISVGESVQLPFLGTLNAYHLELATTSGPIIFGMFAITKISYMG
jgi:hypothetical protein